MNFFDGSGCGGFASRATEMGSAGIDASFRVALHSGRALLFTSAYVSDAPIDLYFLHPVSLECGALLRVALANSRKLFAKKRIEHTGATDFCSA